MKSLSLFLIYLVTLSNAATLDWDNHDGGANGWTAGDTSAEIIADGITFDMTMTGDLQFVSPKPEVLSSTGSYSHGNPSGEGALDLRVNFEDETQKVVYKVDFSEALANFSVGILDIDARFSSNGSGNYYSAFRDTVKVRGIDINGNNVAPTVTLDPLAPALYHSVQINANNNTTLKASQNATGIDLNNPLDAPLTMLLFEGSITGIRVTYKNSSFNRNQLINGGYQVDDLINNPAFDDPTEQLIRISDFNWTPVAVPEPTSSGLLCLGGLIFILRRKH